MVINLLKSSIINPFLLRKCFLHSSEKRRPQMRTGSKGDKIRGCCFSCCLPHSFQCVFSFLCLVLWSFKTRPKRRLEELTVKTRAWAKKWVCVYPLCKSSCKVTDFQSHGQQMEVLQMILCCHWASTASLTSRTSDKTRKTKWRHIEN